MVGPACGIVAPDPGDAGDENFSDGDRMERGGANVFLTAERTCPRRTRNSSEYSLRTTPASVLRAAPRSATPSRPFSGSLPAQRLTVAAPRRRSRGAGRDRTPFRATRDSRRVSGPLRFPLTPAHLLTVSDKPTLVSLSTSGPADHAPRTWRRCWPQLWPSSR